MDGDAIRITRGFIRDMADLLSAKNIWERSREKCLEAGAAKGYSEFRHLRLPLCTHAPTRFPYEDRIAASIRRIAGFAASLDRFGTIASTDRELLLEMEERLDGEIERLSDLMEGREELLAACYPTNKWQRAFLKARVEHLGELTTYDDFRLLSSSGLVEEVLEKYRRREDAVPFLLEEAETTLGIILLDREQRRYFERRTRIVRNDVYRELIDASRHFSFDGNGAKDSVEIVRHVRVLFGQSDRQYIHGEIIPEAAFRKFFEIREKLVLAYEMFEKAYE